MLVKELRIPLDWSAPTEKRLVIGVGEQIVPNNESIALHMTVLIDPPLEDANCV